MHGSVMRLCSPLLVKIFAVPKLQLLPLDAVWTFFSSKNKNVQKLSKLLIIIIET